MLLAFTSLWTSRNVFEWLSAAFRQGVLDQSIIDVISSDEDSTARTPGISGRKWLSRATATANATPTQQGENVAPV